MIGRLLLSQWFSRRRGRDASTGGVSETQRALVAEMIRGDDEDSPCVRVPHLVFTVHARPEVKEQTGPRQLPFFCKSEERRCFLRTYPRLTYTFALRPCIDYLQAEHSSSCPRKHAFFYATSDNTPVKLYGYIYWCALNFPPPPRLRPSPRTLAPGGRPPE